MRLNGWLCGVIAVLAISAGQARAQGVFTGGSTVFDPQISVVNAGAILDAKPVVSHDMRSVSRMASKIALLHERHIVFFGDPEEMFASEDPYIREFLGG